MMTIVIDASTAPISCDDVGHQVSCRKAAGGPQGDAHGGVDVRARDVPEDVDHDHDGDTEGEADEQEAGHVGPLEEHNHGHHGQRTEEHEDVSTDQLRDGALHKSRLGHSVTSRNELTGRWSERGSGSLLPDPRSFQVSVASNAFSYQRQTATFHWQ